MHASTLLVATAVALATTVVGFPRDLNVLVDNVQQISQNKPLALQVVPTLQNFTFAGCLPPNCHCDVCGLIVDTGSFAPLETRAYEYIASRGCFKDLDTGLVVDVGANAGYFAAHALSMGCSVLALEPNPAAASLLQLNMALNRPKPVAVGASHATARAAEKDRSWGVTRYQAEGDQVSDGGGIRMVPLSALVPKDKRIMLLKIDTEGFEDQVLAGAMDILEKIDNILVEVKDAGEKHDLLLKVFHTGGFKHVYGYTEKVNHQQTSDMEDHWYTREPLPTSFLTT